MELQKNFSEQLVTDGIGEEIFALAAKLYPICRSITGDGVRETLREIGTHIDLHVREVATGTPVFDWTIPREWNIRDAYIKDVRGEKIVDFRSNLHVMSYSIPVRKRISLAELKKHVYTLPDQPELTPYRTSYYAENWALCMPHRQFESLQDEIFDVVIDSTLEPGSLTYGEFLRKGETEDEVLLSAHVCHPSLANDNCSGWRCWHNLPSGWPCPDALQLPLPLCSRNDRGNYLARLQRGKGEADQTRPDHLNGRRWGRDDIQEKPARKCGDRPAVVHVLHDSGSTPTIFDSAPMAMTNSILCARI